MDLPFNDVPEGYWAYDAIQYVYGEGLMAGTSGSTFNPEGTTTRGQIVTILWRLSGSPVVNYLMDFDDVDPAAYYAEAIRWATSEGVVTGYCNGLFGTNDPITREQLAVMLHRYASTRATTCPSARTPTSSAMPTPSMCPSTPSPPSSGPAARGSSTAPATAAPSPPRARRPERRCQ